MAFYETIRYCFKYCTHMCLFGPVLQNVERVSLFMDTLYGYCCCWFVGCDSSRVDNLSCCAMCLPQSGILVAWKADGRGRPVGQPVGQQKLDEQLTHIVLMPPPALDPA